MATEIKLTIPLQAKTPLCSDLAAAPSRPARPVQINRDEIIACGLGQYLDDVKYTFIPLTRGMWTVVDVEDGPATACHLWFARKSARSLCWYASRSSEGGLVHLHRIISSCPSHLEPDHRNHNGLDNTRLNLRICTHSQNIASSRRRGLSYRGTTFHKRAGKWQSAIRVNGKLHHLGYFHSAREAAHRYDGVASVAFGSFATLNFPATPDLVWSAA